MEVRRVVSWFSCGITSAVASKMTLEKYGPSGIPIVVAYIDTGSEVDDNLRFIRDCEKWFQFPVTILKNPKYDDTYDVYKKTGYIAGIHGARCSLELKKKVRQDFEDLGGDLQVFGYTSRERRRAERFVRNNPEVTVEFPLIEAGIAKAKCMRIIQEAGIEIPILYRMGYRNNNCGKTGCVKGAAGYWNKIRRDSPEIFNRMAKLSRKMGARLVMRRGKHIFLDELDPSWGNYKSELPIHCGFYCGGE